MRAPSAYTSTSTSSRCAMLSYATLASWWRWTTFGRSCAHATTLITLRTLSVSRPCLHHAESAHYSCLFHGCTAVLARTYCLTVLRLPLIGYPYIVCTTCRRRTATMFPERAMQAPRPSNSPPPPPRPTTSSTIPSSAVNTRFPQMR